MKILCLPKGVVFFIPLKKSQDHLFEYVCALSQNKSSKICMLFLRIFKITYQTIPRDLMI